MRRLNSTDNGRAITFFFNGRGPISGTITFEVGMFYICSDEVQGDQCMEKWGWRYSYNVPDDILLNKNVISNVKFLDSVDIIVKTSDSGHKLFRRIYSDKVIFVLLGSIQKTPEDCEKPSNLITIMDWEYLKKQGWTRYETEQSAEDRLKSSKGSRKLV